MGAPRLREFIVEAANDCGVVIFCSACQTHVTDQRTAIDFADFVQAIFKHQDECPENRNRTGQVPTVTNVGPPSPFVTVDDSDGIQVSYTGA